MYEGVEFKVDSQPLFRSRRPSWLTSLYSTDLQGHLGNSIFLLRKRVRDFEENYPDVATFVKRYAVRNIKDVNGMLSPKDVVVVPVLCQVEDSPEIGPAFFVTIGETSDEYFVLPISQILSEELWDFGIEVGEVAQIPLGDSFYIKVPQIEDSE